jgi:hypothetical protein
MVWVWLKLDLMSGRRPRQVGLHSDAEVDLRVHHQCQVSLERAVRVGLVVDRDDEFTAAAQQLVDRHVFDVAAVGQVAT